MFTLHNIYGKVFFDRSLLPRWISVKKIMSLNFPNHFEDVMWCLSSLSESPILLNYFKIAWIKYFLECIESTRLMVHGNPLSLSYVIRGQFNQCVVWSLLEKRSNFSPSSCSVLAQKINTSSERLWFYDHRAIQHGKRPFGPTCQLQFFCLNYSTYLDQKYININIYIYFILSNLQCHRPLNPFYTDKCISSRRA